VRISLSSQDVIHSFWVPALHGKRDLIPGHRNAIWIQADRPGTYEGQCAEFCGLQHAAMTAEVEAMPREEFEQWLEDEAEAQEAGTSGLGEETYAGACAKCHGPDGEGDIGPRLRGSAIAADAELVERIVRNGRRAMPPVGPDWGERQMEALTDYLQEGLGGG
jgi:cytochrome c oxidase subunit 2